MIAATKTRTTGKEPNAGPSPGKIKFEVYGEEMLEKKVKMGGTSSRIYLPFNWVGHHVTIIRID